MKNELARPSTNGTISISDAVVPKQAFFYKNLTKKSLISENKVDTLKNVNSKTPLSFTSSRVNKFQLQLKGVHPLHR